MLDLAGANAVHGLKSAVSSQQSQIADGLLGLAFLILYLSTCLPSVLPADNGEFQLVAWKLGIAHPPGYPLYTLVGFLFSRFFASPAFALNLMSAVLASITLAIVSRTVRLLTRSIVAGVLAAAVLGTSTTYWAQATTANIRMPTAFFTALCVSLIVQWSRDRAVDRLRDHPVSRSSRQLVIFSFVFSLGLGHHPSILFPGVFFALYIILVDPAIVRQPRRWLKPALFFMLGLMILLYLPLRAAAGGTLADGESMARLAQPNQLLDYVLARGFEGDFFYFINTRPDLLVDRIALIPTLFDFQFNGLVAILTIVGAIRLIWRERKLAVLLLGSILLHTFITITYRAPQTVEYLMPAYVLLAIVVGCSLGEFSAAFHASRITQYAIRSACLVAIILLFWNHLPSFNWLRQHDDTRAYAESLLNDAPQNASVLSNWHWANPMWYLQQVEGLRSDVAVDYVFPRGEPLSTSWLNSIQDGLAAHRPVVADMFFRDAFNASPYFFYPIGAEAFEALFSPLTSRPPSFVPLDINFSDRFHVIGYQLLSPAIQPGEPLTLLIAYRVEAQPDRDYSFFVHLVDGKSVIGQSDQTLQTTRYHVGDVIVARFLVAPLTTVNRASTH